MRKFTNKKEAEETIHQVIQQWSDMVTITNVRFEKGIHGYFVDMTANKTSYLFLKSLSEVSGDGNPAVFPNENETIDIAIYILTNDSGE